MIVLAFVLGVVATLLGYFLYFAWPQLRMFPRVWRQEADCMLAPWLRALRRGLRGTRMERCFACGRTHEVSFAEGDAP